MDLKDILFKKMDKCSTLNTIESFLRELILLDIGNVIYMMKQGRNTVKEFID